MNDILMTQLRMIDSNTCKYMFWNVFLHDSTLGVKLWLLAGFEMKAIPLEMLFYGNEIGLIPAHFVLDRIQDVQSNAMSIPELIEIDEDESNYYSMICTDEFIRAIRIIRSHYIMDEDRIAQPKTLQLMTLSQQVRVQAAILADDAKWLSAIVAESDFEFSTRQLTFAARCGSIECFRFLSINGAEYEQGVLEAAVYRGNSEIVQMCLEHGCDVKTNEVMRETIRGGQTDILDWLIDVHEMSPTATDVATALMNGRYEYVVRFESALHESHTITFGSWAETVVPRQHDCQIFVDYLLNNASVPTDLKNDVMTSTQTILYCDDVELADKCGIEIGCFDLIVFSVQNNCHNILRAVSQMGMIDAPSVSDQETALVYFARFGALDQIVSLVEYGANVNANNNCGSTALMHAAYHGNIDVVRFLVEHGANVKAIGNRQQTAISFAAGQNHFHVSSYLTELGAPVDIANDFGITPLMCVAAIGNKPFVEYLVDHGADVNATNYEGFTPVLRAACGEHLDIVTYLVEHGADINHATKDERTAMLHAACHGLMNTVMYLLDNGVDLDVADKDGNTAMFLAITYGHFNIVMCLVEHGVNVNFVGRNGRAALYYAAQKNRIDIVKYLVANGADVDAFGNNGVTALVAAVANGFIDIVDFLVEQGANVNLSFDKCTPLNSITRMNDIDLIKYLVEHGADVNGNDKQGKTALMAAVEFWRTDTIEYLIDNGANIDAVNNAGETALILAVRSGCTKSFTYLIEQGANVHYVDQCKRSVLMHAASAGWADAVIDLIEHGADPNVPDVLRRTPLMAAAFYGFTEVVRILVENGAKVNAFGDEGRTALADASNMGHTDIVAFLVEHGASNSNFSKVYNTDYNTCQVV